MYPEYNQSPPSVQESALIRIALALLVLGAAAPLRAQQMAAPVTVREAEREIQRAQDKLRDLYLFRGTADLGRVCNELAGENCFKGDRECLLCLWDDDDMPKLGRRYDDLTALVARAPRGIKPHMLEWLDGQRVGTWARLGELSSAKRAAEQCLSAFWWCEALRAFVEHLDGDYAQAELRFRGVLKLMRAGNACHWKELVFFRDSLAGRLGYPSSLGFTAKGDQLQDPRLSERRPCPDDHEVEVFWTLADPLFTRPGNDRLTEHYARLVEIRIHDQFLETVHNSHHQLGHHTVVLRKGWPVGIRNRTPIVAGKGCLGFVIMTPLQEALVAPPELFDVKDNPRLECYRPAYGSIESLPLQTGFFRRAGEPVMLVRAAMPAAAVGSVPAWSIASWNGSTWLRERVAHAADTLIAWLPTPWQPQVVSLEAGHAHGAYRARTGNRPPEVSRNAAVSSLVILDGHVEATTLDAAARAMLPTTTITARQRVSGYFEFYSAVPRNAVIEIAIKPIRDGFLNRIGIGRQPERSIRWTEELTPERGVAARSVALDLEALPEGDYDIILSLLLDGGDAIRSVARVVVVETRS